MKSLVNKTIIITGAAGGFGQQFIKQLLEQGAQLILTDMNKDVLEKSATDIIKTIPNCKGKILGVFASDLSTKKGCEYAFNIAISISPVDILINNAGLINYGAFHEIPLEKWEKLMQVNLMAPMYLSYFFMKHFAEKQCGHILSISSVSGFIATAYAVPYSVSKFGIRGFGMALHKEAKPLLGINITNVYPFYSPTPLLNTQTDGNSTTQRVPKFMYDAPQLIVRAAIKGLRKNKLHVYPGIWSRVLYMATKLFPLVGNMSK